MLDRMARRWGVLPTCLRDIDAGDLAFCIAVLDAGLDADRRSVQSASGVMAVVDVARL